MGFVPVEKLTNVIENKFEAVLVAAKQARIQNSIHQLRSFDPDGELPKMTSLALQQVIDGEVEYTFNEEPTAEEASDEQAEGSKSK